VQSTTEIIQLAGAFGAGGAVTAVVSHSLSRRGEKRQLRAKIGEELSAVRALRRPVTDGELQTRREADLAEAQRRLLSAAMLAGLPRKLVKEYNRLTAAALTSSKESVEANGQSSLPGVVTDCLDAAHKLMSDFLYQPVRTRVTYPFRFWWLRRKVEANKKTEAGANLRWAYVEP
jgi:hypothetical protein